MKILLEKDGWRLCWDSKTNEFECSRLPEGKALSWSVRSMPEGNHWHPMMSILVDRLKMLEKVKAAFEDDSIEDSDDVCHAIADVLTTNPNGKWKEE